jgi:hypothetical protein
MATLHAMPLILTIVATVLVLAGACLTALRSRIIAWCLFVAFAVLAVAWGYVSIEVTKPFTDAERFAIGVIAVVFSAFAIWSLVVAVRGKKERHNEVA